MKPYAKIIVLLLAAILLLSCAPYKMKAIRAQRDQRYDLSIKFALKHLSSHPNDNSVIQILDKASAEYYKNLIQKIQHFEQLSDWNRVAKIAEDGHKMLLKVANVYSTEFPTKKELDFLESKSKQSRLNEANEVYAAAVESYQNSDWEPALEKLKQCQTLIPRFKDSENYIAKINSTLAQKYYGEANGLLAQGSLTEALDRFEKTEQYVPNFLDVSEKIGMVSQNLSDRHYQKGRQFYEAGKYKVALSELKHSLKIKNDHAEADKLIDEIKNKLTVRLAVFPFETARLEPKFGSIASDNILTKAMFNKNDLLVFLDRQNLQKIFEEQALSQTGAIDEKTAVKVGQMSGVNTIAIGSVTLTNSELTKPTRRTLTGHYKQRYRDAKGVQREKKMPFNYIEYEVKRNVEVALSYRLINVETGEIVFSESLSEQETSSAEWITCTKKFVKSLSSSERGKLKASKTPASEETLINQALKKLSQRAASKIVSEVSPL